MSGQNSGDSPQSAAAADPSRTSLLRLFGADVIPGRSRRWRDVLANAGLPPTLTLLCTSVVAKTKLRSSEKAEVARELVSHFQEGIEAGRSPAELARDFGDVNEASRLIRRAVKRKRSFAWHAWVRTWQTIGILIAAAIILYAALIARVYFSKPTISRNYAAEHNARLKEIPEADRAWPLYEKAFALLQPAPKTVHESSYFPSIAPGNKAWEEAVAQNKANQPALAALRAAAAAKKFDAPISSAPGPAVLDYTRRSQLVLGQPAPETSPAAELNPPLYSVLLPHLSIMRSAARQFRFDTYLALDSRDAGRIVENLRAVRGMADHLEQENFIISNLVSLATYSLCNHAAREVVSTNPEIFSNQQLVEMAHSLAAYPNGQGRPRVTFEGELNGFDDVLQRIYSDNGHGDGHPTREGMKLLAALARETPRLGNETLEDLASSAFGVPIASRAEVRRLYRQTFDHAQRIAALPLWERTERADDAFDKLVSSSKIARARYTPAAIMMPALTRVLVSAEITAGERDGAVTGIALELYKRRHGNYPTSLEQLVPALLPAVPLDRFDGKPLRYQLRDGKPLLYSVASDYEDNGGIPSSHGPGLPGRWVPRAEFEAMSPQARRAARLDVKGDWILWPLAIERIGAETTEYPGAPGM